MSQSLIGILFYFIIILFYTNMADKDYDDRGKPISRGKERRKYNK
jgi:hypothetical protein